MLWTLGAACLAVASIANADGISSQSADEASVKWVECGGAWPQKGCEAALVWGDWEKGTHGWWVRAPKGHTFSPHSHTSPERILLVRGRMIGAVDGGKEPMILPGMYWALPGKAFHWARCEDACLMYITYDSGFDLSFR